VLRRERDLFAPEASIHTVVDTSVPRALLHYAERWGGDLMIVGSNPAAEPGRVTISRGGRQLLYDAPFALAVAARGIHEHPRSLRGIGVGYDGGPEAEAALGVAADLARAAQEPLRTMGVVDDWVPAFSAKEWLTAVDSTPQSLWAPERERLLTHVEAAVSRVEVPADVSVVIGNPGRELREFSDTVDLLVVGSRRWGPVARLVSGGIGETLVAGAGCSVLIVPRPQAIRHGTARLPRARASAGTRATS
jgi:nucleotide-binding universal stress UspA family protein